MAAGVELQPGINRTGMPRRPAGNGTVPIAVIPSPFSFDSCFGAAVSVGRRFEIDGTALLRDRAEVPDAIVVAPDKDGNVIVLTSIQPLNCCTDDRRQATLPAWRRRHSGLQIVGAPRSERTSVRRHPARASCVHGAAGDSRTLVLFQALRTNIGLHSGQNANATEALRRD
jgi:hypothetical protein